MHQLPNSNILAYLDKKPQLASDVLIASGASIIGEVKIGKASSIWFNTVLRGDVHYIHIGSRTNIQDNSLVHVTHNYAECIVGDNVTVGHSVTLHGCKIEDNCLIGMGALILDKAVIKKHTLVAAGSIVPPGKTYPENSLIMGSPAKFVRNLTDKELENFEHSAQHYVNVSNNYINNLC